MTEKRTPGIPEEPCKRVAPAKASSEARLEALQNIFLSPPKFVVGTTASEQACQLMVGTKGGLSAFWEDAIRNFNRDLETLVRAAATFEAERKAGRHLYGVRSANGRVPQDLFDRVVALEEALKRFQQAGEDKGGNGLQPEALEATGKGIHTATDGTSPAHVDPNGNPKEWAGIPTSTSQVKAAAEHNDEEANPTEGQMQKGVAVAQKVFGEVFGADALKQATTPPPPPPKPKQTN